MNEQNVTRLPLLSAVLLAFFGSFACNTHHQATHQPPPLTLIVRAQNNEGLAVRGAIVNVGSQQHESDVSGVVVLHVPVRETVQTITAECPASHQGEVIRRTISPIVFESGQALQILLVCEPAFQYVTIAVSSECKNATIYANDQLLGSTVNGMLHARYARPVNKQDGSEAPPLRLVAHSSDPQCLLRDFVSERALATVEFSAELDEQTTAFFISFDRKAERSRYRRPRAPLPDRPYRL